MAATAATSFLVVSFSSAVWMSILGVIFASISAGLGELSFLSLTVYFSRDVLGGWGSGTGAAGVAGALLYSILTQVGLSPQITLLTMLVVPFAMLISYFFLLVLRPTLPQWRSRETEYAAVGSEERQRLMDGSEEEEQEKSTPGPYPTVPLVDTVWKMAFTRKVPVSVKVDSVDLCRGTGVEDGVIAAFCAYLDFDLAYPAYMKNTLPFLQRTILNLTVVCEKPLPVTVTQMINLLY